MSVIAITKATRAALGAGLLFCSLAALPACSILNAHNQSTVAQGKYYASGNPRYDEFFFAGLYVMQVQMDQAPHVPELSRLSLAHALGATPQASSDEVAQRLHEEAQKLSRSGLRMRLDRSASSAKPDAASAAVRTSERPKESATVALLAQVESAATALLRCIGEMKQADETLDGLELAAGGLDANVNRDFGAGPAKLEEVQKNLADSHKLIALMKVRSSAVQSESEQLLSLLAQAINTDDGSLGPATEAPNEPSAEAGKGAEASKKAALKATVKPKPRASAAAVSAAAPARPKPVATAEGAPPAKASKAPAATRDFEP